MRKTFCFCTTVFAFFISSAQISDTITEAKVAAIMGYLASDSLKGRGNFTPELHKAAFFISKQFEKDSLLPYPGLDSFLQPFTLNGKPGKKDRDASGNYKPSRVLFNVVGVLPGRSKPEEIIIFSAHYDHLGLSKERQGDPIRNGANDNASGTTALLMLAHYFALRRDNERTLVFCAFGGEEMGLYGSMEFTRRMKPRGIKAVINVEMIGQANVAGRNTFFVTGARYSNLDEILAKNLSRDSVTIVNEPDEERQLFQRSDNFPFALKGIPAHTIMSSDDSEACYHRPCDELQRIDLPNMTALIRAIAVATRTLVDGSDTPSRLTFVFGR